MDDEAIRRALARVWKRTDDHSYTFLHSAFFVDPQHLLTASHAIKKLGQGPPLFIEIYSGHGKWKVEVVDTHPDRDCVLLRVVDKHFIFENLWLAWRRAAKRKRSSLTTAVFESRAADEVLTLQKELLNELYTPGPYRHFEIHEPKRRRISAAPFRDRVVHHALCQLIESRFESVFITDSYANRVGKGTHRAVDRFQQFSKKYRYVLRMDIEQHFAAIDHAILLDLLTIKIPEQAIFRLIQRILASGCGILDTQYEMHWFPGDDLLAACRPRGLPIGNLTSQFWSNCYLHPLDLLVKRELGCRAYLRYVDDFALFHDRRDVLWRWKRAIVERLQTLRLTIHDNSAQVTPTSAGIPWLGFVIFPDRRRIKGRKLRYSRRRLWHRYAAYCDGEISFAEFDATIQGWINYVRYADSWRLREAVLSRMPLVPARRRSNG